MPTHTPQPSDFRLGVLAFGDSITNGGGELQWGVALQSWAQWVARGLGLPFTSFAFDGAMAADVLALQIPRHAAEGAIPNARYHLGCLYVGVNDVRDPGWDPEVYRRELSAALACLGERCSQVLAVTIPLKLGRPRIDPGRIATANAIVEAEARGAGALVLDLRSFGARNQVMADRVHPTAFGQIAIAERALAHLAADESELPTRVAPHTLISYETLPLGRLRGDLTLTWRIIKAYGRHLRISLAAGLSPR